MATTYSCAACLLDVSDLSRVIPFNRAMTTEENRAHVAQSFDTNLWTYIQEASASEPGLDYDGEEHMRNHLLATAVLKPGEACSFP